MLGSALAATDQRGPDLIPMNGRLLQTSEFVSARSASILFCPWILSSAVLSSSLPMWSTCRTRTASLKINACSLREHPCRLLISFNSRVINSDASPLWSACFAMYVRIRMSHSCRLVRYPPVFQCGMSLTCNIRARYVRWPL